MSKMKFVTFKILLRQYFHFKCNAKCDVLLFHLILGGMCLRNVFVTLCEMDFISSVALEITES